ncbi:FecR family protein [Pedobacter hartonius]|uniref:FecR family protein n=1 Tax=Pedobacter hartonius TaxID=425514 RepID=A0A1H3WVT4_9SPHI|nr:FecR family protein [Pedobacter hartonius]SDZ90452.1 FecR family protein [Pedobacter hartonius]
MNIDTRLNFLFKQYVSGSSTPEETAEFMMMINNPQYKILLYKLMDQYLAKTKFNNGLDEEQKTKVLSRVFQFSEPEILAPAPPVQSSAAVRLLPLWTKMMGAAIVLIALSVAFYFSNRQQQGKRIAYSSYKGELKPGGNKAILILANGTKLCLTDAANGQLAEEENVRVSKTADGRLVYQAKEGTQETRPGTDAKIQYNTISTPAGGQYQVLLPDGTHVWMNAASSLKYPISFADLKERRVELTGEAYFEVSKIHKADGRMPFIVTSRGQEVEVLGTHFNVNAYREEKTSVTTLLEGSVRVRRSAVSEEIIAPGEQAVVNEHIKVSRVDTAIAVAWKNGIFKFDDADIHTVMNQLSRWYDIDVAYQGKLPANKFNGEVYRNMDASKAFRILSLAKINFRIETPVNNQGRRRIVITQN